ncbi:MAG: T9SS type A sorting domain-containing protein [Saprospiraceae bacterium]
MKFRLLLFLIFCLPLSVFAQKGNSDSQFILTVCSADGPSQILLRTNCTPPSSTTKWISKLVSGEAIWAVSVQNDSTGCGPILANLHGKVALIKQGSCSLYQAAWNVQQAGAIGILILTTSGENTCLVRSLSGNDFWGPIHIPIAELGLNYSEQLISFAQSGQSMRIKFGPQELLKAYGARSFATPLSQVDTLDHVGVLFKNGFSDTLSNLILRVRISGPNGYDMETLTPQAPVFSGEERVLFADPIPPPSDLGKYTITCTIDGYTASSDTLYRTFRINQYVFANDNYDLPLETGVDSNDLFLQGYLIYQTAALYWTGDVEATASCAEMGIYNPESVYDDSGDEDTNSIFVLLYDADADGDGIINLQSSFDSLFTDLVGWGKYVITNPNFPSWVWVGLQSYTNPSENPKLKRNHPYYLSLLYDGNLAGSGHNCAFFNSQFEDYLEIGNGPVNPIFLGGFQPEGWTDRTIAQRLIIDNGCVTPRSVAGVNTRVDISPNPANDYVILSIELPQEDRDIRISLFNAQGQVVKQQRLRDFESGTIQIEVRDLPPGNYILALNGRETSVVRKLIVYH